MPFQIVPKRVSFFGLKCPNVLLYLIIHFYVHVLYIFIISISPKTIIAVHIQTTQISIDPDEKIATVLYGFN